MNFRFFSNLGRAAFSHIPKSHITAVPKNSFMKKITQMTIVNLSARGIMPITSSGLLLQNLSQILDKKQNSIGQLQSILGALIGSHSQQGMITLDLILMDLILIYQAIISGVQLTMSNISKLTWARMATCKQ